MSENLPHSIPCKKIFDIDEVSRLCNVKPHVIRYWEREFLRNRFGFKFINRRYYKHHEVLVLRKIYSLIYEKGFTINGVHSILNGMKDFKHFSSNNVVQFTGKDINKLNNEIEEIINSFLVVIDNC
ncbi:MerR family transcriptional regulator [Candidatus Kinetoplastidibacterium crithidiae]|uniref:MlrA-like transcription regulator n=1 Tax=Candidatus Kinetoplastidibacterium crithidiae TCC036E TaxID=1208918 RepID=M1M625_9PROT|nr:MerR family transcriptional regulator [Candidatus Kinetoplastibacterium crithidii]AFZ82764.1 MerR family transcriptional regulator [Candidatus Kinetoplastibacterium crithidii (ex Angomonas deanei ATCC 30255)]AGF47585.1 MlrA-like transcription regulator [Candidatus Kinetoplastibacterium crithidii TCC036E]